MKINYTAKETRLQEYQGIKVGEKVILPQGIYSIEYIEKTYYKGGEKFREYVPNQGHQEFVRKSGEEKEILFMCKKIMDIYGNAPQRSHRCRKPLNWLTKFDPVTYAKTCENYSNSASYRAKRYVNKSESALKMAKSAQKTSELFKEALEKFKKYEDQIQNSVNPVATAELQPTV